MPIVIEMRFFTERAEARRGLGLGSGWARAGLGLGSGWAGAGAGPRGAWRVVRGAWCVARLSEREDSARVTAHAVAHRGRPPRVRWLIQTGVSSRSLTHSRGHAHGKGRLGLGLRTGALVLQSASRALTSRRGDRGEIVAKSWRDRGEIVARSRRDRDGTCKGRQGREARLRERERRGMRGPRVCRKGVQGGQGVRECPNACVTPAHPSPPGTPGTYPWCPARCLGR